jgi:outer membrane protein
MNRTPSFFAGLMLLGVLSFSVLPSCKQNGGSHTSGGTAAQAVSGGGMRIAYVDIDTFEAHYESLKKKKAEFQAQQDAMENELERSAQQMQSDYANVMKKQQAGTLTQTEADAAQKRLGQAQQSLETRRAAMSSQMSEKLQSFNKTLHKEMDAFLADYTREHGFDYVLSYSQANASILFANKSYDITPDVIKGMNERAAKASPKDAKDK